MVPGAHRAKATVRMKDYPDSGLAPAAFVKVDEHELFVSTSQEQKQNCFVI